MSGMSDRDYIFKYMDQLLGRISFEHIQELNQKESGRLTKEIHGVKVVFERVNCRLLSSSDLKEINALINSTKYAIDNTVTAYTRREYGTKDTEFRLHQLEDDLRSELESRFGVRYHRSVPPITLENERCPEESHKPEITLENERCPEESHEPD